MDRTAKLLNNWVNFSATMEQHIKDKGLVYDQKAVSFADIASDVFWADSLIKYALEVKRDIEAKADRNILPSKATLMSIAHIAQILTTRYYDAPIITATIKAPKDV